MEELIRRSIIATGMLGARWTVTHPCTVHEAGGTCPVSLQRNMDYLGPHIALAREHGVGIALKTDLSTGPLPWQRIFARM